MKYAEFIARGSYSKDELFGLSQGNLVDDPPPEFIRLPAPPMLMVDRVVELQRNGARGKIVGEQDIHLTDWFFQCHFRGDPVQPGCLGVDAVWQLVGLYCAANGAPGSGRALGCKEVEFSGQIRPYNKVVRYEVEIRRFSLLKESGSAVAVGTAKVLVDGELIYLVKDAKVGMFQGIAYPDYPKKSEKSVGGIMDRSGSETSAASQGQGAKPDSDSGNRSGSETSAASQGQGAKPDSDSGSRSGSETSAASQGQGAKPDSDSGNRSQA